MALLEGCLDFPCYSHIKDGKRCMQKLDADFQPNDVFPCKLVEYIYYAGQYEMEGLEHDLNICF